MPIQWNNDLSVGIEEIDNQHRELIGRINQLFDACNQGKGKAAVQETIKFLEDYVIIHFGAEEKAMVQYGYPDYASHKVHHQQFVASFGELKNRLETDGPGAYLVVLTNRIVVDWLNSHIRNVDKILVAYLKTKLV
jgi:hemerythrin